MTAEEYIISELTLAKGQLQLTKNKIEILEAENHRLECIIDTLKAHAKFDGEYVCIMVGGYDQIKERNFLVKELELKKEENA